MATMKASERIKIIKRIQKLTAKLSAEELRLTYGQFGIEYNGKRNKSGSWEIEPNMDVSGEVLQELYDHLVSDGEATGSTKEDPTCWEPNCFKLFLSHVSDEKHFVTAIKKALASFGIFGFVAHQDIEPTKEWIDVIEQALSSCHALAALLTTTFHKSFWTDQEIGYCLRRNVPILPVRLGIDPYGFLGRVQGFPGSKDPAEVAEQMFSVLLKKKQTAPELTKALVEQFAATNSYAEAHQNYDLLEKVPNEWWTQELLDKVKVATRQNGQINGAYYMEGKVKGFLNSKKGLV